MGNGEPATETAAFFTRNYGFAEGLREEYNKEPFLSDLFSDEYPQRRVAITRPFYLGLSHVTRGQFRQFADDTGYVTGAETPGGPGGIGRSAGRREPSAGGGCSWRDAGFEQTDDHPVVNVTWNEAIAFCVWLSCREDGTDYRLPTEAEWEYACRAGTTTRYWCGDDPEALATVGNVADAGLRARLGFPARGGAISGDNGYGITAPAASFRPNPLGLFDVHGNAWEWCSDWYHRDCYRRSPVGDPAGPSAGQTRVLRGGSRCCSVECCRSAARSSSQPGSASDDVGFRVARTIRA